MINSKYLPIGSIIGKHYEIIDILGEDDFEILYLVRNTKQKESFFVIKELFLETFSSRDEAFSVLTISEAQGVFEKRKKEIISELDEPKNRSTTAIQTYGYIKENNTVYTVMEYTNNSDVGNYLQFEPKEQIFLPALEDMDEEPIKTKKGSPFFKFLIIPLLFALGFFGYKMFQENNNKTVVSSPSTVTTKAIKQETTTLKVSEKEEKVEKIEKEKLAEEIPKEISETNSTVETIITKTIVAEPLSETTEANLTQKTISEVNKTEEVKPVVVQVREPSDIAFLTKTDQDIVKKEVAETKNVETRKSETKKIEIKKENPKNVTNFSKASIQKFLNSFILDSAKSSSSKILTHYDVHVKRYFNLKNVNHAKIKKDILKYNKKWKNRTFKIANFKILKTYKKGKDSYCDIITTTKWTVSNKGSKKLSGTSKGFMTLKKVKNGFKVSSIYSIK